MNVLTFRKLALVTTCLGLALVVLALGAPAGAAREAAAHPNAAGPLKLLDPNKRWVISHPHIVNLFWDNDFSAHNPYSRHQIDVATKAIADSHYLDDAAQYGVGHANFVGSHSPSQFCPTRRPGTTVSSAKLLEWVTCEVSTLVPPSRVPVTNDLFVVYVPKRTTVLDGPSLGSFTILGNTFGPFTLPLYKSCKDYDGYHFLSLSVTGPFAYAVVPIACASDLKHITEIVSHEIVEAATDPVLTTGWIDDAYSLAPPKFDRLLKGEAADLCELGSGAHPTSPLNTGQVLLDRYWSNATGACVAHF